MPQECQNKPFHFKSFSDLDNSPDADYLIHSMDVMMSLDSIQKIKTRALSAMNIQDGDKVLEIGCGHGEDAEALGKLVGENGSVIAIDLSSRMIEEAKRRSKQANVEYLLADVNKLTYPDHTFSSCHADRFLVSHGNIEAFFKNILRLIKPGGVFCFTDADALSIIMTPYGRATQIILNELHHLFVNPYIGRTLPEVLLTAGLKQIDVFSETSMIRSFKTLSKIFQFSLLAESAIKKGLLTSFEVNQWFEEMHEAEAKGSFLYCITFFTALGLRP